MIQLLDVMCKPIAQALAIEKSNKGGRPEETPRNYAVQELAKAWAEKTGHRPPSGKTGPFFDWCAEALGELGLSTVGLEDCIYRTVAQLFPQTDPPHNPP